MRFFRSVGVAAIAVLATSGWGVAASAGASVEPEAVGASGTQLAPGQIGRSANVEFLGNTPHAAPVDDFGTDIAFSGDKAFVGNYDGFVIYDVSTPATPRVISRVLCPGSQNDVTISGTLLYLSTDSSRSDSSCSSTTLSATNKDAWEGIKIFDVSDPADPKYIKAVETKCGSHTNTLVPSEANDYIYVSSYGPSSTTPDCLPPHDLISIVKVPKTNPTAAAVVDAPVLFPDGGNPGGSEGTNVNYRATSGCHDITAYPSRNIAAGACMGDGVIMDISNPEAPKVIETVRDTANFAFWHSATFNNKGTKVVFTDELGGGGLGTCNPRVGPTRGANAIYDLSADNQLTFRSYFKISRHQNDSENCVAHNGSLIPVAGRDVMVQSWYQGGVSFWDFTDSDNPREIGYFERGPLSPAALGGSWSAYYYNGHVFSSDITKGFDVLRITDPSLKKAADVAMDELNPQSQPVYPKR